MKADFSGYASRNGLKCSDGRTIVAGAFEDQDGTEVPLVWSHQHDNPENVLGHALLENRPDGVYAYAVFNKTDRGQHAKEMVRNGDITALSIFAKDLIHKGADVVHGKLKEVSLVMAGANPGAYIDNVMIAHSDGSTSLSSDEGIIYTDESIDPTEKEVPLEPVSEVKTEPTPVVEPEQKAEPTPVEPVKVEPEGTEPDATPVEPVEPELKHADTSASDAKPATTGDKMADDDKTVKDVFDGMSEEQQNVVFYMIGEAVENKALQHEDGDDGDTLQHSYYDNEGNKVNVFDQDKNKNSGLSSTLSHDDMKTITADAVKTGSFKESFLAHAESLGYGVDNIDILFPDAKSLTNSPDVIGRRTEWVANVLSNTKHSPFSRIKSTAVDLTADEARAKGYVKGNLKKDEIIKLLKRVTTPSTIYKKQRLDRDDIVDITDLDVVAWLKAEMRVMLDEEIARAILVGDGRDADDEDKIDADHIRPIAFDSDMYAHKINFAGELTAEGIIEQVLRSRTHYKGSGNPTFYTTDEVLTTLLLVKDAVGRRLYETQEALSAQLRVSNIVTVEVMDDTPEIVGIIVNLTDYTVGADAGGNVSLFDDFDIDYNQYKYLIETRISGALTKPKSALVLKREVGTAVTPQQPSYNGATHTIAIPNQTGVVYSIDGNDVAAGNKVINESTEVEARPKQGFYFPKDTVTEWQYTYTA
jgi:HK97 family phage prohead protease